MENPGNHAVEMNGFRLRANTAGSDWRDAYLFTVTRDLVLGKRAPGMDLIDR
jgi:hypothetical protein